MPSLLHQIRRGTGPTVAGILPAYATPIGTPLGFASVNPNTGERTWGLSNECLSLVNAGVGFIEHIAFQARDSRIFPGLNDPELLYGFGLETPYYVGTSGSAEPGADIEVEGPQYVLTSAVTAFPDATTTGLSGLSAQFLTSGTAVNTELTIANGLLAVAVTGDIVLFRLVAIMTNTVAAGNLRVFATKVMGYKK
jgi:hypothetical protein